MSACNATKTWHGAWSARDDAHDDGVKRGFYRFTVMSWHIYACPHQGNCEGGTVAGQASCVEGAFGALCELCEDGYYLEGDTMRCELCEDAVHGSRVIVLIVMLCTAFVVLVAGAIFSAKHAGAIGKFYDQHKKRIKHTGAKITAFVVAMQIIVLVKENHEDLEGKALPNPYMYFVELLGFLALDVMEFIPMACISGRVALCEAYGVDNWPCLGRGGRSWRLP